MEVEVEEEFGGKKKEENFRIFVGAPNFESWKSTKLWGFLILEWAIWRLDLPKRGIDRCLEGP